MAKTAIFEKLEQAARDYGLKRLAEKSGISRQGIYRLMTEKNPRFETLKKIADVLSIQIIFESSKLNADDIYSMLRSYGAPINAKLHPAPLRLEEAIAYGIVLSRKDGFMSSIIPYVLHKQSTVIDASHLIGVCDRFGESRALGYYADLANTLQSDKKMKLLADLLHEGNYEFEDFFKSDKSQNPHYKKLAAMVENPIAKKWGFQTIDSLSDQLERYRKWLRQEESHSVKKK